MPLSLPHLSSKPREAPETFVKQPKKPPKKKAVKKAVKKPRAPKAPKTRCSGTMTEAQFFSFIRSALRQKSRRWKPLYDCLNEAKVPYTGDNKRRKWSFRCAICKGLFEQKQVSVDHVVSCGSLRSFDDLPGFASRLFCERSGLRVLCNECHKVRTEEERNGHHTSD